VTRAPAVETVIADTHRREWARLPLLVEPEGTPGESAAHDPVHDAGGTAATDKDAADLADVLPDERLRLIFTCCHPALAVAAQVALTLRLVCGVPVPDIARAFLVAEPTMAARITRAKKKISVARIPYRIPGPADLPGRLRGLYALLLVTDARRATRVDAGGRLLRLSEQDRSRWDAAALAEARDVIVGCLRACAPARRPAGPPARYVLQAAIASLYAEAPRYDQTDWPQIVAMYDKLLEVWPSPVVALNRTVPLAMVCGPEIAPSSRSKPANDRGERTGVPLAPPLRILGVCSSSSSP
jgi:predicted RNA polymerase sigma factor